MILNRIRIIFFVSVIFVLVGCSVFNKNKQQTIIPIQDVLSKQDSVILGYWYIGFDEIIEEYDGFVLFRKKPTGYHTLNTYKFNSDKTYTLQKNSSDTSELKTGQWEIKDEHIQIRIDNEVGFIRIFKLNRLDSVLESSFFAVYRNDQTLPCNIYKKPFHKTRYSDGSKFNFPSLSLSQRNDSLMSLNIDPTSKVFENKYCEFNITINCEGEIGQVNKSYYRYNQEWNLPDTTSQKLISNMCQIKIEPCREYVEQSNKYIPIDMTASVKIRFDKQKLLLEYK